MAAPDALNPKQHHEYFFTRDSQDFGDIASTEYKSIRRTMHETGEVEHHQVGHLEVVHHPEVPEHIGRTPAERREFGFSGATDYDEEWYHGGAWKATPVGSVPHEHDDRFERPVGYQGKLFEYGPPEPAYDKVDNFQGTREHRAQNMVMLGMAQVGANEDQVPLKPSTDLSEHSSRLVGHLQGKGAVPESASTRITNDIQFHNPYKIGNPLYGGVERVPQEQVEAGRQAIRQVIRGDKKREIPGQQRLEL